MSAYPDLVRALQTQRTLYRAICVQLDFKSGLMRVWNGPGPLATKDPFASAPSLAPKIIWNGLGQLGQVSSIDRAVVSSQPVTLSLSGVDPVIAGRALSASSEVRGQPCRIFEQYFDGETIQPVDIPVILYSGVMDTAPITVQGPSQCTVSVKLLTLLYRRRIPAVAYLSDRTQKSLYPNDDGCSDIPGLVKRDRSWPTYSS